MQSLCRELPDFDHVVLTLNDDQPLLDSANAVVYTFDRDGPFSLSYSRSLELKLMSFVRKNPATTVHVHGLWSGLGWSVKALLKKQKNLRYIVSPHGMLAPEALRRRKMVKRIMAGAWERSVLKNSQAVHCLTAVEEEHVMRFDKDLKTFVQPHVVDFPFSYQDIEEKWKLERKGRKSLLYIGRIHETKGLTKLVKYLSARAEEGDPVSFRLDIAGMGEPSEIASLRKQIEESTAEITFLGPVFAEAKKNLMLGAHGIVLPSKTEGLPMSLIEGAAHGLPIFATKECNLDWVELERAGLTAPYGRSGIARLVDEFDRLSTGALAVMGMRAATAARGRYSSAIASQQWRSIYAPHALIDE